MLRPRKWSGPGPARWASASSCRRRISPTLWISAGTEGATSGTPRRTCSDRSGTSFRASGGAVMKAGDRWLSFPAISTRDWPGSTPADRYPNGPGWGSARRRGPFPAASRRLRWSFRTVPAAPRCSSTTISVPSRSGTTRIILPRRSVISPIVSAAADPGAGVPMGAGADIRDVVVIVTIGLLLAACAGSSGSREAGAYGKSRGYYKVGAPYQVNGVWYNPRVDYNYDETGTASWYGEAFNGKSTANGEIFDLNQVSAAHKTLQLPSVVEVTNLQNSRALKVRVNDRGPFAGDRLIDLSRRAAQLLGFERAGTAPVRVRIVKDESINVAEAAMHGEIGQIRSAQASRLSQTRIVTREPKPGGTQAAPVGRNVEVAAISPTQRTPLPIALPEPILAAPPRPAEPPPNASERSA